MKKIFFLLITGLTVCASYSQEVSDAIRYAQDNLTGTARFRAMGGAFGAVGGDLSAITINPAGSSVFANNQAGVTFSSLNTKNNSNYFETKTSDKENSFILNQAGAVFIFNDRNPKSDWKKIAIGITYENNNNFNNNTFSAGINPMNSVAGYFLDYANGIQLGDVTKIDYRDQFYSEQQAAFGYFNKVILPVSNNDSNTQYISNVPTGGVNQDNNYYQENEVHTTGYNSKASFNISTSFKDRLYLGANLNVHITDYRRTSSFYEDNSNPLETTETISSLRFNNELYTYGNGFSFQLGAIGKVTNDFRLGITYESNTWYELYDEVSQSLYTTTEVINGSAKNYSDNPNIVNVYDSYKLQTPDKWTFSGAYIFGKSGLISIDYSIKNYGNTKYKPINDEGFRRVNTNISNELTSGGDLRIGAEYKIKLLSLRGGYRHEDSPYKNGNTIGDLNSYSGGLGYNFGATKVDLAYSYLDRKTNQGFFDRGFTNGANINSKQNNVTLTLLFEL